MGKFALLIGVSQYSEGENPLSDLPAALNDVRRLAEVLNDPKIGEFDSVLPLENPSIEEMRSEIANLFSDRKADDLVLLYFSGHGITDQQGNFFFSTPKTYKKGNLLFKPSAIPARDVHDEMNDCASDRMVVILDCCHSGAFGDSIRRDSGEIGFEPQLGGKGRVVLTASAAIDYSYERSGEELAVYTRYLIEGIKSGAADRDEDGYVSADELHDFVVEKLAKAAPGMSPQRYIDKNGEKIKLTRAIVADPTRRYRKAVKRYSQDGVIRPAGRRNLEIERLKLGLSREEADSIEADELRPYLEYKTHKAEYEQCFRDELEFMDGMLDDRSREELNDLIRQRSLKAEDVEAIEQQIMQELDIREPVVVVKPIAFKPVKLEPVRSPAKATAPKLQPFTEDLGTAGKLFGSAVKLEMLPIPAGEFMMGSPASEAERSNDAGPQHLVKVSEFYMGKFPITQAQWAAIAKTKQINCKLETDPSNFKGAELPVESIFWHEAIEFCDRLSRETGKRYSLPSEAQWEYACRAEATTPFYFGETIDASIANYCAQDGKIGETVYPGKYGNGKLGEYRKKTTPVGYFKDSANKFGLYDMHGNVWEWCADPWHENYEGAPIDGSVWDASNDSGSKVLRGGSWGNSPGFCRSARRSYGTSDFRYWSIGFRVVSLLSQDS
jgi:formylglycine-generating enzyme required for sulfatase activity